MLADAEARTAMDDVDIWHVKLASGETGTLSLDELDAGFHAGWITPHTLVLPAGALRWAPLAEVAGLDETRTPGDVMPPSIAPLAFDNFAQLDAVELTDEEKDAFRSRGGRKVFGVLTALIVVAGLGYAGVRARPAVQRALASRGATHTAPPAPPAPIAIAAPQALPAATTSAPAASSAPTVAVPSMVASALPNAAITIAPGTKTKPARPAGKRAK